MQRQNSQRPTTPDGSSPDLLGRLGASRTAIVFAVLSILLVGAVGAMVDYSRFSAARAELQKRLDDALIVGAHQDGKRGIEAAEQLFDDMVTGSTARVATRRFERGPDGLSGTVSATVPTTLSNVLGIHEFELTASGRVRAADLRARCPLRGADPSPHAAPCASRVGQD